jgi:N-acetyl-gamma-glutamylphosphate reductase
MHAAAANTVMPYSLEGHRHAPEIEGQLARLAGRSVTVDFSTAHGNFPRGIFLQANVVVREEYRREVTRDALLARYREAYAAEHFIQVVGGTRTEASNAKDYQLYPDMASVIGSNFTHLGLDYDPVRGTIKVISVIDNLVKGAAGSAIQNMNVMMGIAECEAIGHYGL